MVPQILAEGRTCPPPPPPPASPLLSAPGLTCSHRALLHQGKGRHKTQPSPPRPLPPPPKGGNLPLLPPLVPHPLPNSTRCVSRARPELGLACTQLLSLMDAVCPLSLAPSHVASPMRKPWFLLDFSTCSLVHPTALPSSQSPGALLVVVVGASSTSLRPVPANSSDIQDIQSPSS